MEGDGFDRGGVADALPDFDVGFFYAVFLHQGLFGVQVDEMADVSVAVGRLVIDVALPVEGVAYLSQLSGETLLGGEPSLLVAVALLQGLDAGEGGTIGRDADVGVVAVGLGPDDCGSEVLAAAGPADGSALPGSFQGF